MNVYRPDSLRAALRDFMQVRDLNPHKWSTAAGISEGTIRNFLAGATRSLKAETLAKLAQAAGVQISDILGGEHQIQVRAASTTVQSIIAQLADLDLRSVRAIREFICERDGAPSRLKELEHQASGLRADLKSRIDQP